MRKLEGQLQASRQATNKKVSDAEAKAKAAVDECEEMRAKFDEQVEELKKL